MVVGLWWCIIRGEMHKQEVRHSREVFRLECFSVGIKEEVIKDDVPYYYLNDGGVWYCSVWDGWHQVAPATKDGAE